MQDLYLKAATESKLYAALESAGIVTQGEDGWHVSDGHKYALDVIGAIYKPTGVMIQTDEGEMQQMAAIAGCHANLRVMGEFDAAPLAAIVIDPPDNPVRGWA